ncbi:hypothetical protein RhiirC2_768670 [Rhizophagus irregularis]|uniref:Uncharacterized protein n=1 Tax=Rhizophagus irregularis TaxID=588596 RepID=A0A2N1P175_9GLOM|nr:hypothetical protein RhiirC2_768670 [Rhizophagus irregularis]
MGKVIIKNQKLLLVKSGNFIISAIKVIIIMGNNIKQNDKELEKDNDIIVDNKDV